jgi:hypothetical protein
MPSKLFRGQGSGSDLKSACREAIRNAVSGIVGVQSHVEECKQYRITIGSAYISDRPADGRGSYHAECEVTIREEVEASGEDARAVAREKILNKAFTEVKAAIAEAEKDISVTYKILEK